MGSKFKIALFLLLPLYFVGHANKVQDSLIALTKNQKDTLLERTLARLSDAFGEDRALSKRYALAELNLAESLSFVTGQIDARNKLGRMALEEAQYDSAIYYYAEAIRLWEKSKRRATIIVLYTRLATAHYYKGDYEMALKAYSSAGDWGLKMNRKEYLPPVYMGMGNIYELRKDYRRASSYFQQGLSIARDEKDLLDEAQLETCIGNVCFDQGKIKEAIAQYQKSLQHFLNSGEIASVADCQMNIGGCYADSSIKRYEEAFSFYKEALNNYSVAGNLNGQLQSKINIGALLAKQGKVREANAYYDEAYKIAKAIGSKEMAANCLQSLAYNNNRQGNYKLAYQQLNSYLSLKDSLLDLATAKNLNEIQTKFNVEKRDLENAKLTQENQSKAERLRQDKIINGVFLALIALGLFTIAVMFVQYKQKQKANAELEQKNHSIQLQKVELENQKTVLEEQHREITDSINYAKQIQQAILPALDLIREGFDKMFLFYQPKAVVSGDFYYYAEIQKGHLLAAVDCTGHGVPGAFMSMIGNNLLAQVTREAGYYHPAEVLNHLHLGVRRALQQDQENSQNRDGMDIALLYLSADRQTIEYAGANRSLYHISNGELKEYKGDKFPIGGLQDEGTRKFTNQAIAVQPGDRLFIFSDGYADQFGGPKGKKLMVKNFQNHLLQSLHMGIEAQGIYMQDVFQNWKADAEQVDDILLIGIEI